MLPDAYSKFLAHPKARHIMCRQSAIALYELAKGRKRGLDLGTGIGNSAMLMAEAGVGQVVTVEHLPEFVSKGYDNFL